MHKLTPSVCFLLPSKGKGLLIAGRGFLEAMNSAKMLHLSAFRRKSWLLGPIHGLRIFE